MFKIYIKMCLFSVLSLSSYSLYAASFKLTETVYDPSFLECMDSQLYLIDKDMSPLEAVSFKPSAVATRFGRFAYCKENRFFLGINNQQFEMFPANRQSAEGLEGEFQSKDGEVRAKLTRIASFAKDFVYEGVSKTGSAKLCANLAQTYKVLIRYKQQQRSLIATAYGGKDNLCSYGGGQRTGVVEDMDQLVKTLHDTPKPGLNTPEFLIGVSVPLTGKHAEDGQGLVNGMQLAVNEWNARGLSIQGHPVKFRLLAEDETVQGTKAAIQGLVRQHVNAIVGGIDETAAGDAGAWLGQHKELIPFFPFHEGAAGHSWIFPLVNNSKNLYSSIVKYILKIDKIKKEVIADFDSSKEVLANAENWTKDNVVFDYGNMIILIKTSASDFGQLLTKHPRYPSLKKMYLYPTNPACPKNINIVSEESGKMYCVKESSVELSEMSQYDKFFGTYEQTFKKLPGLLSTRGYDSVNLIATALQKADSTDFYDDLLALKLHLDFHGIAGVYDYDPEFYGASIIAPITTLEVYAYGPNRTTVKNFVPVQ